MLLYKKIKSLLERGAVMHTSHTSIIIIIKTRTSFI